MLKSPLQHFNLVTLTGVSASSASGDNIVLLPESDFNNIVLKLKTANVSGTSPTLDLYLQTTDDEGTTWYDSVHFTQLTGNTTNPYFAAVPNGGASVPTHIGTVGDATISAAAGGVPLLSRLVRVKAVIGGTTPAFDITLDALINNQDSRS